MSGDKCIVNFFCENVFWNHCIVLCLGKMCSETTTQYCVWWKYFLKPIYSIVSGENVFRNHCIVLCLLTVSSAEHRTWSVCVVLCLSIYFWICISACTDCSVFDVLVLCVCTLIWCCWLCLSVYLFLCLCVSIQFFFLDRPLSVDVFDSSANSAPLHNWSISQHLILLNLGP